MLLSRFGSWQLLKASGVAIVAPLDALTNILFSMIIPARTLGINGILKIGTLWTLTNNANAKTVQVFFGGVDFTGMNLTVQSGNHHQCMIRNRGLINSQIGFAPNQSGFGNTTGVNIVGAVDCNQDQILSIAMTKGVGADNVVLEAFNVEAMN